MVPAGISPDVGAPEAGRTTAAGASGVPSFLSSIDEAALNKLVERALAAHRSGRASFAASLWGRALEVAAHTNTLAVVKCTLMQATCLSDQACATASADERAALQAESWALVSSVMPLLSTRMDENTLLPGRCTKTEVDFYKRLMLVARHIHNVPPRSARDLQLVGFGVGYVSALLAAVHALMRCGRQPRPTDASERMEFVIRVVDMVRSLADVLSQQFVYDFFLAQMLPASHSFPKLNFVEEVGFAHICSDRLRIDIADPLLDALRARWTAPAMVAMRTKRGLLDVAVTADIEAKVGAAELVQRADTALHGLKTCSFPLCGKVEATVLEFRSCSACRSVWYCSSEHGALHWTEHKPTCRAAVAAKRAAASRDDES